MTVNFEVVIEGSRLGDAPIYVVKGCHDGVHVNMNTWDDGVERGLGPDDAKQLAHDILEVVERVIRLEEAIKREMKRPAATWTRGADPS